MMRQFKVQFIIVFIVFAILISVFINVQEYQDDEETITQEENFSVIVSSNKDAIKQIRTATNAPDNKKAVNCASFDRWRTDGGEENLNNWSAENMFTTVQYIAHYGQMKERDLVTAADNNDPYAIYALALNYRWYSRFTDFNSLVFSPFTNDIQENHKKRFDRNIMNKAKALFFQAALNGYPSALIESTAAMKMEINELRKIALDDESVIKNLEMDILAYKKLFTIIVPELANTFGDQSNLKESIAKLSKEDSELFARKFESLNSKWLDGRELLGFGAKIELTLSEEDIEFGLGANTIYSECL